MPHIKNALIRYRIIDRCLRNKFRPYPTKFDLRKACEEALFGIQSGLNICDSTIEKDMFAMKMELDAPIRYSKRYGGYYYEDPGFSINDIPLTEEDLSAIRFALKTLTQFREVNLFRQFGNAIDKIVDRVSIANDPQDADLDQFIQFEAAVSSGGSEYLPILLEAVKNRLRTTFDYSSFQSGVSKWRNVLPLCLREYRNRWYVITFDLDKAEIITYALDRIGALEVTNEPVERPEFDQQSYFKHAVGISASNKAKPVRVVIKADAVASKYIETQPFHNSQTKRQNSKHKSIFEMNVFISEELIRSILSFAGEVEVLEPSELRDEIRRRTEKMKEIYLS